MAQWLIDLTEMFFLTIVLTEYDFMLFQIKLLSDMIFKTYLNMGQKTQSV